MNLLPVSPEARQNLQTLACALQGWLDAQQTGGNPEILEKARRVEIGHAGLLRGWSVRQFREALPRPRSWEAPPGPNHVGPLVIRIIPPWERSKEVPWAQVPGGFRGARDAALDYLAAWWLPDYEQILMALQIGRTEG
jgi:hypothetical protein